MTKPRRTAPRKASKPARQAPDQRPAITTRQRRREALEQQERARSRPLYPDPEADTEYRP
jgi:hypothetical protein